MRVEKEQLSLQKKKTNRSKAVRAFFAVLGALCIGIAAIGIALPVLPTAPFLLLAAFFFARSSERLNNWFRRTKLYKTHLEILNYGEGMTWPAKLRIIVMVTAVMGLAEFFMLRAYLVKDSHGALFGAITMAAVWVIHIIAFCFIIKTCPKENAEKILKEGEKLLHDAK